jgi:RNA polymerase sigma factor (sigma-70 family)
MSTATLGGFLQHLRKAMAAETMASCSDGELIERFLASHDEASFHALLRRHGPMVCRVCRRALLEEQDVEDAFQGTFLVLARQAHRIRKRESLASWLHGVAYRVARDARKARGRRRKHEEQVSPGESSSSLADEVSWKELRSILDEELVKLPERLRAPLVLCYLQGLTQDEAAQELEQSKSTFRRNLERGREVLGSRLRRRGATLAAALAAPLLSECTAPAAVSAALIASTCMAAAAIVAGQTMAAGVSARAALLAERLAEPVSLSRVKIGAVVLLAIMIAGFGRADVPGSNSQPAAEGLTPIEVSRTAPDIATVPGQVKELVCKVPCLILEDVVQRELKLSREQYDKIVAIVLEADRPHADDIAALRKRAASLRDKKLPVIAPLNPEDMAAAIQADQIRAQQQRSDQPLLAKIEAARNSALRQALSGILSEAQLRRMRQVELQLAGLGAFGDPEVEKTLALSEDQKAKIRSIYGEPVAFDATLLASEGIFLMRSVPRVLELLSEQQRQAWHDLSGQPVELQWPGVADLHYSFFEMRRVYGSQLNSKRALALGAARPGVKSAAPPRVLQR